MNPQNQQLIETILSSMSLQQKIGQTIVVGMSGTIITNDLREAITRYHCGGIRISPSMRIFRYFSDDKAKKNPLSPGHIPSLQKIATPGLPPYKSPRDYASTLNELKFLAGERNSAIPLHIVLDQEGDTSKDLSRGGILQFPSNMGLASTDNPELTYRVAKMLGKQLKASGISMIHSPVVDVNTNPDNPEIGRRAFSDNPDKVAIHSLAMVNGFRDAGIIACAKHFPGRGDSSVDAHHACPRINKSRIDLDSTELLPYKKLIKSGVPAIMVAHGVYTALDPDNISTVSRKVIYDLLRNDLQFKGVITTDSITMGALIDKFGVGESCARALKAGADIILMKAENQWRGEMFATIEEWVRSGEISEQELDDKVRRILQMKIDFGLFENQGIVDPEKAEAPYRDPQIFQTAWEAAEKAIMICKDELKSIPLKTNQRVLLINQNNSIKTPNDRWDHPALLQEKLEINWPGLQTFETSFGLTSEKEEEDVIQFVRQGNFDVILCTNFYDRSEKPHRYPKTLIDEGFPIVLITNTPYKIQNTGGLLPEAKSIILNMNLTPIGLECLSDLLLGKRSGKAQWPISNYDPLQLRGAKR